MEMIIIICLIIVIALLLHDKLVKSKGGRRDNITLIKNYSNSKDIVGKPKQIDRMSQKIGNLEGMSEQISPVVGEETEIDMESFEQMQINHSVGYVPDFEEEEEELWAEGQFYENNKFATGVTFEELSLVGTFFLPNMSNTPLNNHQIQIMQKIEGTELLMLLENSLENASQKIAKLLSVNESAITDSYQLNKGATNSEVDGFDIDRFL